MTMQAIPTSGHVLTDWRPEEAAFWAGGGKRIAILGYGNQGRAQALNLKDSGLDVVVGLRDGSPSKAKAEADGIQIASLADAASSADVIMFLAPDEALAAIYRQVEPEIAEGAALDELQVGVIDAGHRRRLDRPVGPVGRGRHIQARLPGREREHHQAAAAHRFGLRQPQAVLHGVGGGTHLGVADEVGEGRRRQQREDGQHGEGHHQFHQREAPGRTPVQGQALAHVCPRLVSHSTAQVPKAPPAVARLASWFSV